MAHDGFFLNRPAAKEYDYPYKPSPPPSNPVLRGWPLSLAASVISNSPFLQRILWANAGFGTLRDRPELDGVDARYEPAVIKTTGPRPKAEDDENNGEYLRALASGDDWAAKRPAKSAFPSCLDYHEAYKSGRVTPTQVIEKLLPLIQRKGKDIKADGEHAVAFLSTRADLVLKAAEASTARYATGTPLGPLDGVPMAVKDEADLAGYPKTLGSNLDFAHKDKDATSYAVQQWLNAGAICIGKTTMHELGMDTTNCNPNFGTPRNPYNAGYYCGGSSGGSAYAVGAGLVPFAMGNDGGGSIRIPASFCGVFGLKTSHGRVSLRPSANLARSTGVAGPIAANMVDLELAYKVMAKPDPLEADSALFVPPLPKPQSWPAGGKKVLGMFRPWFDRADAPVAAACQLALDHLSSKLDYSVVDITLPLLPEGQLAHAMTILAEIASGTSSPAVSQLTPPNKILLSVGKTTPAVDLLQAQKLRNLLMQHLAHLFAEHPGLIIVTPTTPIAGWKINDKDLGYGCSDGNASIRNMEFVWVANFTGCPAISVPVGCVGEDGVPVGLMGMGEWGAEEELIGFGYDVEGWLHQGLEGGRARPGNFVESEVVLEGRGGE